MRYTQAASGDWIKPKRTGWKMRCCDCRLVHVIDFKVVNGRVHIRPFRDNRATAASRRKRS